MIDATGLVVAPGFIDTHFHSVDVFATKMAMRVGVTTGVDLEQGTDRVGEWYALKEREGWQINFGTTSSLLFTLSQLSYWSALHLGDTGLQDMKDRGRVQVGKIADLTLIDGERVTDNPTMKKGEQGLPSTGLPYVIVNGTIVVKSNEVLPVKPGKPIRFPVEGKGRFAPVNVTEWLDAYTIPVETMHFDDTGAGEVLGENN